MAGYIVVDAEKGECLASFRRPVKGCDVAVTRWTENPECAMVFRFLAAARFAAAWLDDRALEIRDEEGRKIH